VLKEKYEVLKDHLAAAGAHLAILAMGASAQPLTLSLQSLPHSLRSGQALSEAKGRRLCRLLLFQTLGQQNLEQRLIGNIALARQDIEPVAHGLPSGPAAFPAVRVVAAPQTRESEFPLLASETPFRKHLGRAARERSA
jgi:hypothetical protein